MQRIIKFEILRVPLEKKLQEARESALKILQDKDFDLEKYMNETILTDATQFESESEEQAQNWGTEGKPHLKPQSRERERSRERSEEEEEEVSSKFLKVRQPRHKKNF